MNILTACALVQLGVLILWFRRWRAQCWGRIGFLFVAATFMYHGWPELVELMFPDRNPYRGNVPPEYLRLFVLVMTVSIVLLSGVYSFFSGRRRPFDTEVLIAALRGNAFLRWPVLLGIALPSYLFVLLRQDRESTGEYWVTGSSYQFTPFLIVTALVTLNIKTRGKKVLLLLLIFGALLAVSDSRTLIVLNVVITGAAMVRSGIQLRTRQVLTIAACLVGLVGAVEISRSIYGRFSAGEQYAARVEAVVSSATAIGEDSVQTQRSTDTAITDSAYRLDGNSYGAMIAEKQDQGYGIVGPELLIVAFRLMVPSFLYPDKMRLEEYERNEEGFITVFYKFPLVDYISGFWSSMESFTGIWTLPFWAILFGWALANLDRWLGRNTGIVAHLVFIAAALSVLGIEGGIISFLFTMRGFLVVIVLSRIADMGNVSAPRARLPQNPPAVMPALHMPARDPS